MGDRLAEVAAAARKAGMSYGQYMAMTRETGSMPYPRLLDPGRKVLAVVEADTPEVPVCAVCGRVFERKRKNQVCCGPHCQRVHKQQLNTERNRDRYRLAHQVFRQRVCVVCGKVFEARNGNRKCCSEECGYARHLSRVTARNHRMALERKG